MNKQNIVFTHCTIINNIANSEHTLLECTLQMRVFYGQISSKNKFASRHVRTVFQLLLFLLSSLGPIDAFSIFCGQLLYCWKWIEKKVFNKLVSFFCWGFLSEFYKYYKMW